MAEEKESAGQSTEEQQANAQGPEFAIQRIYVKDLSLGSGGQSAGVLRKMGA